MPVCPGTGKMPKLTCPNNLAAWQVRCNECNKRLVAMRQRKEKDKRDKR